MPFNQTFIGIGIIGNKLHTGFPTETYSFPFQLWTFFLHQSIQSFTSPVSYTHSKLWGIDRILQILLLCLFVLKKVSLVHTFYITPWWTILMHQMAIHVLILNAFLYIFQIDDFRSSLFLRWLQYCLKYFFSW